MNNWLGTKPARLLVCPRCGVEFTCSPEGACWCMEESATLPIPVAGEDCLCRDCLRKAAETEAKVRA